MDVGVGYELSLAGLNLWDLAQFFPVLAISEVPGRGGGNVDGEGRHWKPFPGPWI